MNNRKAFTLIELLVVIGIIAILAGLLLPAVSRMYISSKIAGQKADFVSISNALQQYEADFGDYPRNPILKGWNTNSGVNPAPTYLSLAAALLGPGPAFTQLVNGNTLEVGDGNDGTGFRNQSIVTIPGTVNLQATPVTFQPLPAYQNQAGAIAQNMTSAVPIATLILTPSSTTEAPEAIGVSPAANSTPALINLTLYAPPVDATITNATLIIPGGKVWGPYLSADTFKVAFIPGVNGLPPAGIAWPQGSQGQPVLLDRWGQVIQYFPRYGLTNNRLNDSSMTTTYTNPNSIQAGPLFGYSQPLSVDPGGKYGQNAIWDFRDGAPFFVAGSGAWKNPVTGNLDAWETWPDPTNDTSTPPSAGFQPEFAIEWMLGDLPTAAGGIFNNAIMPGEKLGYDGPFILISAGPNGPELNNGGYCNFAGVASNQLQQTFLSSGNVYNFDHP
jgi:prepilin-type N-terminal cleavage/methylation domain-containing protein